jgi:hypothetical protein
MDKIKPWSKPQPGTEAPPIDRYAPGSAGTVVEPGPCSQQRRIAMLVSPRISGHSFISAASANSIISGEKRVRNLEG